jgi:hypothetical protein
MAVAIKEQQIDGETVIFLGPAVLVKSKSQPETWYSVEAGRCTCPGYQYRKTCRHLGPAALATELHRCNQMPVETMPDPDPWQIDPFGELERRTPASDSSVRQRIFGDRPARSIITPRDDLA